MLHLLTRRDYSQLEISQKLKAKGYEEADIALVIADVVKEGLINEARFIENYIYWRRNRGFGPKRISQELKARGIADLLIADQLKITDNAWFTDVRRVFQKHFKGKRASDLKERAKQLRFLQYRGFTQKQINSVFDDITMESEED